MRINKMVIEQIVSRETSKKFNKIKDEAKSMFDEQLAIDVLKKYEQPRPPKELEEYIQMENRVNVSYSWGSKYAYLSKSIYSKRGNYGFSIKASKELEKIKRNIDKLDNEVYDFRKNLSKALSCFSTSKRLLEAMPELSEYFKDEIAYNKSLVPMELISKVRKQLAR